MKRHKQESVPQHLLPEYDDYVDDAVDLVRGRLSKDEEAVVRKRMAEDPIYKAVIDDIVDAESAPPLPPAVVEASLQRFWQKAGLEPDPVEVPQAATTDLEDYAQRVKARERVWRRRLMRIGAVAATIVGLMFGSWFYFDSFWTEHRTHAYVTARVDLPDGSTVTLDPGSRLRHLDNMRSGRGSLRRDVYLSGSGDFYVRHLGEVPFSVITPHARIVVVGTRFRIEAAGGHTIVRVVEGRVTVEPVDEMEESLGPAVNVDAGFTARAVGSRVLVEPGTAPTSTTKTP